MTTNDFTREEAAEYKAINHDIEEALKTIGGLKIRKSLLLKQIADRTGNKTFVKIGMDHPNG